MILASTPKRERHYINLQCFGQYSVYSLDGKVTPIAEAIATAMAGDEVVNEVMHKAMTIYTRHEIKRKIDEAEADFFLQTLKNQCDL